MIILLIAFLYANEPEFTEDVSEELHTEEIQFIDNLDKELLEESVKDIPIVKLDGFSDPGEYKFTKEGR